MLQSYFFHSSRTPQHSLTSSVILATFICFPGTYLPLEPAILSRSRFHATTRPSKVSECVCVCVCVCARARAERQNNRKYNRDKSHFDGQVWCARTTRCRLIALDFSRRAKGRNNVSVTGARQTLLFPTRTCPSTIVSTAGSVIRYFLGQSQRSSHNAQTTLCLSKRSTGLRVTYSSITRRDHAENPSPI